MDHITEFAGYKLVDLEYYHRLEKVAATAREFAVVTETPIRMVDNFEESILRGNQAKNDLMQALEELDE